MSISIHTATRDFAPVTRHAPAGDDYIKHIFD
jgi:hypothetical protein